MIFLLKVYDLLIWLNLYDHFVKSVRSSNWKYMIQETQPRIILGWNLHDRRLKLYDRRLFAHNPLLLIKIAYLHDRIPYHSIVTLTKYFRDVDSILLHINICCIQVMWSDLGQLHTGPWNWSKCDAWRNWSNLYENIEFNWLENSWQSTRTASKRTPQEHVHDISAGNLGLWLGWIPRNFKISILSLNCHFWGKNHRNDN